MAFTVLAFEGFDWCTSTYTPQTRSELWSQGNASLGTGRFGGVATSLSSVLTSVPLAITDKLGIHVAIQIGSSGTPQLLFKDSSAGTQFEVTINSVTKRIELKRGTTVVATGINSLAVTGWYSLNIHFYLHDTSGRCVIKVDGATEVDFTGDTKNTTVTNISYVQFVGSIAWLIDDVAFYLPDTVATDWISDCKVSRKEPNGAGASTQFAVTGAASNWQAAASNDGDSSYVDSSTPGQIDLYAMSNASPLGQVYAVQVGLLARKDDAATRQVRPKVRIASTNYDGGTKTLNSTYAYQSHLMLTSPATGSAWGLAETDSIQAGVEEIA